MQVLRDEKLQPNCGSKLVHGQCHLQKMVAICKIARDTGENHQVQSKTEDRLAEEQVLQVEVRWLVVVVQGAAGHAARGAVVQVVVLEAVVGQVGVKVVLTP